MWALLVVVVVIVVVADPAKFGWLEIIILFVLFAFLYLFPLLFFLVIRFLFFVFAVFFANEVTQIWITFVALC